MKKYSRKSQRREDAEKRRYQYNLLSVEQKIALAKSRRGNSKKEIGKLLQQLADQTNL